VVCLDKTGTLTTNQLRLDRLCCVAGDAVSEQEVRRRLCLFASASVDNQNKTVLALRATLGKAPVELLDQIPFKSQNRFSAVRIRDGALERVLVLGACDAVGRLVADAGIAWESCWNELLPTGLRLLTLAEAPGDKPLIENLTGIGLRPLAVVGLSDELRPEAASVLERLSGQGISFKVISGDHPDTVRATVRQIHLALMDHQVVSGDDLERADDKAALVADASVFGRVSPHQKVEIVKLLQAQGRHVAMIGDGVNDVLPIKQAHLGIAMGAGTQAAKTVAGLVLENNDFALLPETLEEGRTLVRNLRRSAKLFLVKNVYSLILIVALAAGPGLFGLAFPYLPQQVTLLNWLVIGIPAFVIALSRERSFAGARPAFLHEVGSFALRTGVVFALAGMAILGWYAQVVHNESAAQRTLLLSVLILLGVTAVFRALTDGEPRRLVGDNSYRLLALAAIPAYMLILFAPPTANFFQLQPMSFLHWADVMAAVIAGWGFSSLTDRAVRR
jgi:cation-transporting ATPase E